LRQRGFELRVEGELTPDGCYPPNAQWIAEKNGFYFCADNPIELLGLTAICDYVQPQEDVPYWWVVKGPDVRDELLEAAFPDDKPSA
jgi:hypothetical protein